MTNADRIDKTTPEQPTGQGFKGKRVEYGMAYGPKSLPATQTVAACTVISSTASVGSISVVGSESIDSITPKSE
jgi:hypothetical protein